MVKWPSVLLIPTASAQPPLPARVSMPNLMRLQWEFTWPTNLLWTTETLETRNHRRPHVFWQYSEGLYVFLAPHLLLGFKLFPPSHVFPLNLHQGFGTSRQRIAAPLLGFHLRYQWTRKCGTHGPKPHPPRDKKVSPWAMDTQSDICIGMNSPVQAPMCHTRVVECCRLQDIRCFFSAAPYLQVWLLWLNYIELKPGPLAKPWIVVKILTSWSKMVKNLKFWEPLALRVNYIIFYAFLWVVHGQIMGFLRLRFKLRVVYAP